MKPKNAYFYSMKTHLTLFYIWLSVLLLFPASIAAQCPASKYGLNPVFPLSWNQTQQYDWFDEMESHGMGLLTFTATWRQLQELSDSNRIDSLKNHFAFLKNDVGIEKLCFTFQNPGPKSNYMPPVWCGNPWTDTHTRSAMFAFISTLLDSIHEQIDYFLLGSETDLYFKTRPVERDSFFIMATQVSDYINTNYPEIQFGISVSLRNGIESDTTVASLARQISDVVAVTYWPLNSNFLASASDIDSIAPELNHLLDFAGAKNVVIRECGFPMNNETGSNENLQAQFINSIFLHTVNEPRIEAVGIANLADYDSATVYWFQNFYITYDTSFIHFISSIGLIDSTGLSRPAYAEWLNQLDSVCSLNGISENSGGLKNDIYPNPFYSHFFVDAPQGSLVQIFDLQGRLCEESTCPQSAGINIKTAGAYFVVITWPDHRQFYSKVIKQLHP